MESETRTHNRASLRHQSAHSNRQLSLIQVPGSPADPLADSPLCAGPIIAITYRHSPPRDGGASGNARAPTSAAARPAAAHSFKLLVAPSGVSVSWPFTRPFTWLRRRHVQNSQDVNKKRNLRSMISGIVSCTIYTSAKLSENRTICSDARWWSRRHQTSCPKQCRRQL